MAKYKVEIDATVKGQKDVDKLNDSLEETQEEQQGISDGFNHLGGAADTALGGAVSSFAKFRGAITASIKSLGVLKVAVAATGLGLLLITIASLKAAFTSTEEGQNKFSKIMKAIGVVTGNIIDLFAKLGKGIISVFENPKKAIQDFWEFLKQNVTNRIEALIHTFGLLGKVIGNVFRGEFKEAGQNAALAGKTMVDVFTGVKNTVDKATKAVSNFIDEQIREIAVSNELADKQAQIDKDTRQQIIERAKLEGDISDLKLKAIDTENYGLEQRSKFLQDAMDKTDALYAEEERLAALRLEQIRERNKLSGSTKDDLDAEAEAEAALIRLQKERGDRQKEMLTQKIAVNNQLQTIRDEDLALEQEYVDDSIDLSEYKAKEEIKIEEWKAKEKKKIDINVYSNALAAAGALFSGLAALAGDDFEKQKKFKIAAATANTIQGAIAAYMGGVQTIPGPFGLILGAALAATTLATGYAQIKEIANTSPESTSTPTTISTPQNSQNVPAAPALSLVTPAGTGTTTGQQQTQQSVYKTFVVSTDMTNQQQLDRRIENQAAFG